MKRKIFLILGIGILIFLSNISLAMNERKEKVLVIGLDGATFDILTPWMEQGKLPNLAKIKKEGSLGELKSTIPPISSLAWPSIFTGNNPGKHGLFGFQQCKKGTMESKINLGSDIEGKKLWKILSEHKKKVIIINVEMTYPPEKVNGILISGVLSPEISVYPEKLKPWLEKQGYKVEGKGWMNTQKKEFLEDLYKTTDKRVEIAIKLMEKEKEWDFFMLLITGTDRIQHYLWRDMEEKNREYGNAISNYYQHVDKLLGKLIEKAGENTSVIIISDHGFDRLKRRVHINNWLEREGYIKVKLTPKNILAKIQIYISGILKITKISELLRQGIIFLKKKPSELTPPKLELDFKETKAFTCGYYDGQIYLNPNLKEKEYNETREELIKKLSQLKDPKTGKKVFKEIYRKEEIYHGPYLENAPDIVLLPENEYWVVGGFNYPFLFESTFRETGRHEVNGIFLASGKRIKKGMKIGDAKLIDITPTILHLFNISPENMDGKILSAALK
jgi:predicted AlkP superfamily phosphohydrolase/phosphomutase